MKNPQRLDLLRRRYPIFAYENFKLEHDGRQLKVTFQFKTEPNLLFRSEIVIQSVDQARLNSLPAATINNFAFHLGLIEMLSYWKATCSPNIIIKPAHLSEDQICWWNRLLLHGMGEYFYVNGIDYRDEEFVKLKSIGTQRYDVDTSSRQDRDLVMISGGKDSTLTAQLYHERGVDFQCLHVDPTPAARLIARSVGCDSPIVIDRLLDPALVKLNAQGYLNGHVPFSATLAMLGITAASLFDYNKVVVSNERSCEEGNATFLGEDINHQYSKTFKFEQEFRDYSRTYLSKDISYFSILRPLYEIQIAGLFANYPQYFKIFKSCNRNHADNSWCMNCVKCAFTFCALYPFLEHSQVKNIFGEDLFERNGALALFKQLVAENTHKPFECVGTRAEILASLYLSIRKASRDRRELPTVLSYIDQHVLPMYPDIPRTAERILSSWSNQHYIPKTYVSYLRHAAENLSIPYETWGATG